MKMLVSGEDNVFLNINCTQSLEAREHNGYEILWLGMNTHSYVDCETRETKFLK